MEKQFLKVYLDKEVRKYPELTPILSHFANLLKWVGDHQAMSGITR